MTPLDLRNLFDRSKGRYALVATYEFDPLFFERRMLTTKGFGEANRIVVLMDRGRYQELINQGIKASGFNRRYLVLPIGRTRGVFHPKLYLVLGDKRVVGLVGSSNCTNGGIAYNMELCSTFSASIGGGPPEPVATTVFRQIYDAIRAFASSASEIESTLDKQLFGRIEEEYSWLHRDVVDIERRGGIELLHSHGGPLWSQVEERLSSLEVNKITVLSPFFDADLGFVERLRKRWRNTAFSVVAQPKYSNLPARELQRVFDEHGSGRLVAATPAPGRRLHAKAIAFETDRGTYWLTGSANATTAAMDHRPWFSVFGKR